MFSKARMLYGTVLSKFVNNPKYGSGVVNSLTFGSQKFLFTEDELPLVKHDRDRQQFYINFEEGRATLKYDLQGSLMRVYSTYVPMELTGRGIGDRLVKEALEFQKDYEYDLTVECGFVKHYIRKNAPHLIKFISNTEHSD